MSRSCSLQAAVADAVHDGDTVAMEGFTHLIPFAAACQRIFIVRPHSKRALVERLDFLTSLGHGEGGDHRARLGITTTGPAKVITDLCVMEPDPCTRELTVTSLHPGVARENVEAATGWRIRFAADVAETPAPDARELEVLRRVRAETENAHKAKEHA